MHTQHTTDPSLLDTDSLIIITKGIVCQYYLSGISYNSGLSLAARTLDYINRQQTLNHKIKRLPR
jgi:hypothetical protein